MSSPLNEQLRAQAEEWAAAGLRRELYAPAGVDFTTNDYLGLAGDDRVAAAVRSALDDGNIGMPASRLLRGQSPLHEAAEREAAHWMGTEAALLLPSGFQANQALLTTFADANDVLFSDGLNHASIIDGMRLSHAKVVVFPHQDMAALANALAGAASARRRLIMVEDLYSMDGDLAPLSELLELCERFDAYLMLDMAHSAGLFEERVPEHPRLLARMFTGGKALGLAGAFICGSQEVIDTLINRARSFVFTTAAPPMLAAALRRAMQIAVGEEERKSNVLQRSELLRRLLHDGGVEVGGESPIVPVIIGDSERTMLVAQKMRDAGFDVRGVRPPTVPAGTSRLRIVVHANHSEEQITSLAKVLIEALSEEHRRSEIEVTEPTLQTKPIVVCGTDTDIGKTLVAAILVRAALRLEEPVRYFKPVQTGRDSDTETVLKLADLAPDHAPPPAVQLALPASVDQAAEQEGVTISVKQVLDATRNVLLEHPKAKWVLECAGGLRVPFNEQEDQADYLRQLQTPVVLVARSGLGTLNHTLLSVESLAARRIPLRAIIVVGQPHPQNIASLQARLGDLPILEVPMFRELNTETIDFWLDSEPRIEQLLDSLS
ncbi:MAG: dethiobiotin synthase [Planctomycetes bacterium]|nr:dethiobiotin synthase [Planctomycetota bacterium]MCP4769925.1 dethiobiotin synthase [Planctomycetota bacterium]MCP4859765.1 dethiobiotin synthase [Planctomycetota bacterium]